MDWNIIKLMTSPVLRHYTNSAWECGILYQTFRTSYARVPKVGGEAGEVFLLRRIAVELTVLYYTDTYEMICIFALFK